MKICLICPQTPFLEYISFPPLNLLYLNSYLKMYGYDDTQIIDLNIESKENIPETDVYIISATTPQFPYALELLELQKIRNGKTIIGGAHATALPESCNLFDKIIIGDGEIALLQCLNNIEKEKENDNKNNKNNKNNIKIEKKHKYVGSQVANIDDLPMPNRNDIDIRKYNYFIDNKLSTIAITSRGCPFSCHFCLPKGTLVLTEDLTYIPIEQIKVGDIVVGLKKDHFISYERSRVLNTFKRIDRIYKIMTMNGDVQSTSEHPWLSDHYRWRKTKNFIPGQFLRKISTPIKLPKETREYKIGYIAGAFEGDGSIGNYHLKSKEGYSQILDISPGEVCEVYNLETTTGNFIADGFVTHNCQKMNNNVRFHSTGYVLKELQDIKDCGYDGVYFEDDIFTMRKDLESLSPMLKKMAWRCQIRPDEKIKNIKILGKMECRHVSIGIESGSQKILDTVNKKVDLKHTISVVKECKSQNIKVRAYIIAGLPSETHDTMRETIEFLKKIEPDSVGIGTFIPYPGTYIYNHMNLFDIKIEERDYKKWYFRAGNGKYNCVVSTSGLRSDEILEYRDKIDKEFNYK